MQIIGAQFQLHDSSVVCIYLLILRIIVYSFLKQINNFRVNWQSKSTDGQSFSCPAEYGRKEPVGKKGPESEKPFTEVRNLDFLLEVMWDRDHFRRFWERDLSNTKFGRSFVFLFCFVFVCFCFF